MCECDGELSIAMIVDRAECAITRTGAAPGPVGAVRSKTWIVSWASMTMHVPAGACNARCLIANAGEIDQTACRAGPPQTTSWPVLVPAASSDSVGSYASAEMSSRPPIRASSDATT